MAIHPARALPFDELWSGLQAAKRDGWVNEVRDGDLSLFCYSQDCTYQKRWDGITTLARGLVLDAAARTVVATPFPKFFNVGEGERPLPDLPFEATEKMDGSLIVIFHHGESWRCATKASFRSSQAEWASRQLAASDLKNLVPGTTYLAEAVYPENRIVVPYDHSAFYLLSAYDGTGEELTWWRVRSMAVAMGWRFAMRRHFDSMAELVATAKALPCTSEGFVIRFDGGHRVKVKGDEYCRIHRLVSRLTPLTVWGVMSAGEDLDAMRRQLPEEFWGDFDAIVRLLRARVDALTAAVDAAARPLAGLTDKEVGLSLGELPEAARPFIFAWRKNGGDLSRGKVRDQVYRRIRPDGNVLPGYIPSSSMSLVLSEA